MNQDSSLIKSVTVYSGSSANIPDTFLQQAFELGKVRKLANIPLILKKIEK